MTDTSQLNQCTKHLKLHSIGRFLAECESSAHFSELVQGGEGGGGERVSGGGGGGGELNKIFFSEMYFLFSWRPGLLSMALE